MKPDRSRVELGPTGPMFMLIAALATGVAIYTQANLMFIVLGLLVGGLLASVLWLWAGMRGLTLERLPVAHGVAGEELVLRYQLVKHSRVPGFSIVITETWGRGPRGYKRYGPLAEKPGRLLARPTGWVMHLTGEQPCQAQASCWPIRRGKLELQRVELHTDFPFGLLRRVVVFHMPEEVLILPRIRRVTRQAMTAVTRLDAGGYNQLDKEGGTEEFYSLRRYRKGDSLKVIDWKHTAKTGKLLSRELTQPAPPTLMILLDLSDYAPEKMGELAPTLSPEALLGVDRAVALTASLICDAYITGYRVGLMVSGAVVDTIRPHRSLPHRTRMLETLAQVEPGTAPAIRRAAGEVPSVIIRPGQGGSLAIRPGRRTIELYGDSLDQLTLYNPPEALLRQRPGQAARSQRTTLAVQQKA